MSKNAVSVGGPTIARMAALAITLIVLAGCGQKGPLTLPPPPGAASASASAPAR